jgi:hypothetical protein
MKQIFKQFVGLFIGQKQTIKLLQQKYIYYLSNKACHLVIVSPLALSIESQCAI